MKARLNQYQQSPRKVRLIADLVRGKKVSQALTELDFIPKKAAQTVAKLLRSAVNNAGEDTNTDSLVIKEIKVDEGTRLYRARARARGRSAPIRRRTSHIHVELVTK
jgi:large subunit ribosomal protein L22